MSKSSPIYISDDSEDEKEEHCNDGVFSEDDCSKLRSSKDFTHLNTAQIKREEEIKTTTATNTPLNISPKVKIAINRDRLKWLSGVIKLASVSPVKNESTPRENALTTASKLTAVKQTTQIQETEDNIPQPSSSHNFPQQSEKENYADHPQSSKSTYMNSSPDMQSSPSSPSNNNFCSSPLKYKNLSDKPKPANKTPKKSTLQKAIESPRKVLFGSPQKLLKQSQISMESFSPKKLMKSHSDGIEDTSHHMPPLHACHFNGYVCSQKLEKEVLPLTEIQLVVLEGIKEEGLVGKYIDTLMSFVSKYRKPTSEICLYLITEVLLKTESHCLATKCFGALKRIQALHPSVPEQIEKINLTWEVIESVVDRMELTQCTCKKPEGSKDQQCVRSFSAFKAFVFLINVMESEARRKQFCLRRTIAFRLLSLQRISRRNMNQVVWWLKECIAALHCKGEEPATDSKIFPDSDVHPPKENNHLHQAISLFQRLIQLSLNVSEDPESCAADLVGELLLAYNQLEHLECRTIFIQSLHSHLLRSKFLEKYLEVYCKDTNENRNLSNYRGIQKIVQVDFERLPQARAYVTEDSSETIRCHGWHRSQQECEEMSMVLSYSLQSYLFSHHKKLQCSPKRMPLTAEGEQTPANKPANICHLSMTDVDEICNMGDKVIVMAGRLMSLCHEASLNARTNQLVELLSDLKLWDPW